MPKSLQELAAASLSANVSTVVDRFVAQNGKLTYVASGKESQYEAHFSVNNQLDGGTITINTHSVETLQRAAGISYDKALEEVLIHELGHVDSATNDAYLNRGTPAAKESSCWGCLIQNF